MILIMHELRAISDCLTRIEDGQRATMECSERASANGVPQVCHQRTVSSTQMIGAGAICAVSESSNLDSKMFSRYLYLASEFAGRKNQSITPIIARNPNKNLFQFLLNKGGDPHEVFPPKRTTALSEAQRWLSMYHDECWPTAAWPEVIEMMEQMAMFRMRNLRTWTIALKRLRRKK